MAALGVSCCVLRTETSSFITSGCARDSLAEQARNKLSTSMWQGLQRSAFAQRKVRATGGPAAGRGKGDLPLSAFPSQRIQPLGLTLHQRSGQGNLIIISSPPLAALP